MFFVTSGRHGHGDSPCPLIATASGNRIETCVDGGVGAETLIASENKIGDGAVSRNPMSVGRVRAQKVRGKDRRDPERCPFYSLLPDSESDKTCSLASTKATR